jgi:hypothetical protein
VAACAGKAIGITNKEQGMLNYEGREGSMLNVHLKECKIENIKERMIKLQSSSFPLSKSFIS